MVKLSDTFRELCSRAEQSSPEEAWQLKPHRIILILGVVAAALGAILLGQDCTWDVLNYHFYSGFALLAKPLNYDFAPAQVQNFHNPLMHVPSYLLLAHLPSVPVAVLLAAVQGLNFYLVFQISQVLFRSWPDPFRFLICICSAATGCYSSIFILELGTTFGDSLTSLLILCGMLLIFRYLISTADAKTPSNRMLGFAGAILGMTFGLKVTTAIYIAAIAFALSVILLLRMRRMRPFVIFFGFLALGFVAVYGIWGWALYREYQNPIFPYMNSVFRSPYYDPVNLTDARFFSRTWQQRFFYPLFFAGKNSLVSEIEFRDVRLALCYLAIVLTTAAALFRFCRGLIQPDKKPGSHSGLPELVMLCLFFTVSYILWQNQFSVYRYLIVLELLAPAFLALVLAHFMRKRCLVLFGSILINIVICAVMIPANFGRQKFDDSFLKVELPTFAEIEKSVVVMSGGEGTSFIIPRFPAETRFVRISSNFHNPGKNVHLDNKIRGILSQYDAEHTLVFVADGQDKELMRNELDFYGIKTDDASCRAVLRRNGSGGYLCGTAAASQPAREIPAPLTSAKPEFEKAPAVRLEVDPKTATYNEMVQLRLSGLNLKAIDVLFSINGELKPPQKKFFLDKQQFAGFPIRSTDPKGLYHFIGIRSSTALDSDPWIEVDARLLVR